MRDILSKLDALGEAVRQLGEDSIMLGYFSASGLLSRERFTCRIDLPGTPGVHGSGASYSEAITRALQQREEDARRLEIEAEVRAETERRMQRKEAA